MKQYIYILVLFVLLFSACSEYDSTMTQTKTEPTTSLAFSYEVPAALSRTTIVPASELENARYDLSIFAFDQDGAFVARLAEDTDYIETRTGSKATLDLNPDFLLTNLGKTLVFYFVANDATSKGGTHTEAIDYANMTAQQFENSLCVPLPSDDGKSEAIEDLRFYNYHEYGLFEGLLMTDKSDPIRIMGRRTEKITLIRRTARFDVRNDFKDTHKLSEFYIEQAPVNGLLFGTGRNTDPVTLRDYAMFYGPEANEYDDNKYTGLFYLYPCTLGEGETQLSVLITRLADNATAYAKVKGTKEIKANQRYTLVFDPVDMTFTLNDNTGDYEEGSR